MAGYYTNLNLKCATLILFFSVPNTNSLYDLCERKATFEELTLNAKHTSSTVNINNFALQFFLPSAEIYMLFALPPTPTTTIAPTTLLLCPPPVFHLNLCHCQALTLTAFILKISLLRQKNYQQNSGRYKACVR